ncbi:type II toxin-antitoxin system VapC family toxin [Mycobacterium intracellulare]|uniref:type II toxin-antitoxin system VapC family toxin n=1 Tax=Mycobacterium intracellulare TaxID=1767 RepID=UPI000A9B4663
MSATQTHSTATVIPPGRRARAHAPEPFTLEHAIDAHSAYLHYGKGRHPAAVNYGDTMAYATRQRLHPN